MAPDQPETPKPERRRFQYSLRSLLLLVLGCSIVCVVIAVWMEKARRERQEGWNNLKQLGLAMLGTAYADTVDTRFTTGEALDDRFPAHAIFDRQGKPLLSWRVHILPHLEEDELYRQFHLDEPWDSPHNKRLIPRMPRFFRNPHSKAPPNTTTYLAVVGKGMLLDGDKRRKLDEVEVTNAHTVIVVEADDDRAVIWTKPEDCEYDSEHPMAGLGHAHRGGFNVLMGDGSVRFIERTVDPETFREMVTPAER
jgi:prepilin-type processing-associated H-X9-DG protein